MKSPRFLLCPPSYFGVQYVINPWMEGQLHHTDGALAQTQWAQLREKLARSAEILLIPPVDGLPDLVFTANAALIHRDQAVLSSFRCAERQGEEAFFREWLREQGFQVTTMPSGVHFEGAGDALLDRERPLLWAGHGFRSDFAAAAILHEATGLEVQPLRLRDPRFYHLDTCFCPLEHGYLLYYADAFDPESQAAIETRVPAEKRFSVPETDAVQFACNAISVDGRVILNNAGPATLGWLQDSGFSVETNNLSEFMKSGGAAKCLSLRLDEAI